MFAILETGGKQYKVEEGIILEVELLNDKVTSKGKTVNFDSVLLIKDKDLHIGQPYVANARIRAKVLETFRDSKIIVFKKKSKKQYKRKQGHRQNLQRIQIEKIEINSKSSSEEKGVSSKKSSTPESVKIKAPAKKKAAPKKVQSKAPAKKKVTAKTDKKNDSKTKSVNKESK